MPGAGLGTGVGGRRTVLCPGLHATSFTFTHSVQSSRGPEGREGALKGSPPSAPLWTCFVVGHFSSLGFSVLICAMGSSMPVQPPMPCGIFIQHFEKDQLSLGQHDLPKTSFFFRQEPYRRNTAWSHLKNAAGKERWPQTQHSTHQTWSFCF